MFVMLEAFYKYGFVIIQKVPTENNFLVEFANKIGSVKRTNFGEFFNVKSIPDPNDLAYTTLHLAPHTDNPYRNPFPPCIQILHCIENEVSGGFSTLVDGFTVSEDLKFKIAELINEKKSDEEIKAFVSQRYGNQSLYDPGLSNETYILWFAPFIFLLIASIVFIMRSKR